MRAIHRVIVHHSAGPETETAEQVRAFHTAAPPKGRGWSDIGYHWFVRRLAYAPTAAGELAAGPWTVEAGRDERVAGAHDERQNADSIGICLAGDYTRGPVPPDGWAVLVATVSDACRRYRLASDQVEGHREHEPRETPTACPGFDPADLREAVARQLGEPGPTV